MGEKVIVDLVPLGCLARSQPFLFGKVVYLFLALAEKQNVRDSFRSCRLFEGVVRQAYRAEQFRPLRDIPPRAWIELIHRAFRGDDGDGAARSDLIHALCEKVVMHLEVVAVVIRIRHSVSAERYVADDKIELIIGKTRILKAFYLHARLWV